MLIAAQHGQGQVKRCDVGNNKINALVYRSSHRAQSLTVCMWLVVCCSSTANKSFPNVYGTEQSPKMPARPFPPPLPTPRSIRYSTLSVCQKRTFSSPSARTLLLAGISMQKHVRCAPVHLSASLQKVLKPATSRGDVTVSMKRKSFTFRPSVRPFVRSLSSSRPPVASHKYLQRKVVGCGFSRREKNLPST